MNTYYQVWKGKKAGEWEVRTIIAKDKSKALSVTEIEGFVTNKYDPYSWDAIYDARPEAGISPKFGKEDKFLEKKIEMPSEEDWQEYYKRIKNRNLKNR